MEDIDDTEETQYKDTGRHEESQQDHIELEDGIEVEVASKPSAKTDDSEDMDEASESEKILNFNFDDFTPGKQYDVVINADGFSVPVRAPRIRYYDPLMNDFMSHHVYMNCNRPEHNIHDRTIIPLPGMTEYLFYSKRFIKNEHDALNGKLNVWRIESLKVLTRARKEGKRESALEKQEAFAREQVAAVQEYIAEFDFCSIGILNTEGINRVVFCDDFCIESADLVYHMCKHDLFQMIVKPGVTPEEFDLVTRFNNDPKLDFVFGKPRRDQLGITMSMHKRLFDGSKKFTRREEHYNR